MSFLLSLLNPFKTSVGKYFVALMIIVGFGITVNHMYNTALQDSYDRGVSDTNVKWSNKVNSVVQENGNLKAINQNLSDVLGSDLANAQANNTELLNKLSELQEKYDKEHSSTVNGQKCFDNTFIDGYNQSLGEIK